MARSFSSGTNRIDCGSASNIDQIDTFTYACWVRPNSLTVTRPIMQKGGSGAKRFRLLGATLTASIQFTVARASTNATCQSSNGTVTVDTWQFLAATFDSSAGPKIFKGSLGGVVAEVSYSSGPTTGSGAVTSDAASSLLIGGDATNSFPGAMAEVKFVGRALTARELTQIMYGEIPTDLKGYWPLEGITSPELDRSGLKNNGTVTGATASNGPPIPALDLSPSSFIEAGSAPPPSFSPAWSGASGRVIGVGVY